MRPIARGALAVAVLILAGCGDDGSESPTSDTTVPSQIEGIAKLGEEVDLEGLRVTTESVTEIVPAIDDQQRVVGVLVTFANDRGDPVELDFADDATLTEANGELIAKVDRGSDTGACEEFSGTRPPTVEPKKELSGCYAFQVDSEADVSQDVFGLSAGDDEASWSLALDF